jgi:hypothetical protein
MLKSVSAGDHRELLTSLNELGLSREQVTIVSYNNLLVAFYDA